MRAVLLFVALLGIQPGLTSTEQIHTVTSKHAALAERLFVVSGSGDSLLVQHDVYREATLKDVLQKLGQPLAPNQLALVARVFKTVWDGREAKVRADVIAAYADFYTDEELQAMLAFLSSPVGAKMRSKTTALAKRFANSESQNFSDLAPAFEAAMKAATSACGGSGSKSCGVSN